MVYDPCQRMDELRAGLRSEIDGKRGMLAHVVEGGRSRSATRSSCCSVSRSAAAADEDHVLLTRVRPEVEPAVERLDWALPRSSSRCHSGADSVAREGRRDAVRADGEGEGAGPSSQTARSKMPGSRSSQRSWVSSMSSWLGAKASEDRGSPRARGASARRLAALELLALRLHVQERAEGADRKRDALGAVALAGRRRAGRGGSRRPSDAAARRATASISGEESTPMTRTPARAIGIACDPSPSPARPPGRRSRAPGRRRSRRPP